jgi:16S rRNA (guanine527-N7)-methyltransferase
MSTSAFPDLGLSAAQTAALEQHYELLLKWNKVLNLTRIERLEDAIERHYRESLFLAARLDSGRVADVGSGAGFPGLVVAVARPELSVTLIESHQRKAVFLREASRKLPNVRVLAKRAEDVDESFDWLISRAVSYADLESAVRRFGARLAFLSGAEEPPPSWGTFDVVPLPSGNARFLRVSRETTLFHA